MNTVTRFLALGALAAASLTQGCGCSGDNNNNTTTVEPPPVETPTVNISGTAMKGVVGGGIVSAFTLDNKGLVSAQPFTTTVTDALGRYTIKIPETYIGKPISFRITPAPSNATQLTCDLDIGCGSGVMFGNKYPLPSSSKLVLETLVPALDKTKNVNLSTFSTLAAEQARKALASNADLNALGAAIKKASGEVANMFGLTGEISELELVDITNKDAVKAAVDAGKSEVLRVGALNAAIISASQSANPGFTLEQALGKLVADITTKGIASNSSDSTVADLTKILTSVSNILSQVKNLNASGVDLTALITSVANDLGRVRNEPVDVYNPGTVTPPAELDVKALAFANVVRELINGGDIVLNTNVGNSNVKAKGDKFRAQLEAAEMLNGDHVDALGKGLSTAAEAIAEAADAYNYDNTLTSYMVGDVKVTIATAAPKVDYSVDQTINGVAVKLMASDTHTETTTGAVETAVGKLELSGSAADSAVKLSVLTGSMLEAGKLTRETKDGVEISTLEGLKLLLKTDVAQLQVGEVTDPVSVSGWLKFEFGTFTRSVGSDPTTKGVLGISFEGTVKNTTGESVALALNIAGDTKGLTFDELAAGVDPIDTDVTDDKFNNLYAALSFNAQLNSQSSAATVKLMTTRESVSATRVSLDLLFGAHNLRFSSSIARLASQPYNLSIANQDRLVMSLTQATEGGDITGSIKAPDGVKVLAEISKSDICAVKVSRKTDGVIVCLIDVR